MKTVRRRSNTIQTTISEWVLDEELPMSQYNSADPHTQAANPHNYTTKPITTTPTPNHTNPICSPTSQITDNKSSDTHRTPTENEDIPLSLLYTDRRNAKPHSVTTVSFKWAREQYLPIANHKCVKPSSVATSLRNAFAMCEKVINEKHQFLVAMLDGMDKKSWDSLTIY